MALFELEILGGATERRYRKMRPEVERMPWGTLDLSSMSEDDRIAARRAWTSAAYQEHRTAVGVTAALRALLEANAPLDLVALAARFPLDEALSIPLIRGTCRAARHPLPRAILARILRDEAAHGTFGFLFLDWAESKLDDRDRAVLADSADRAITSVSATWEEIRQRPPSPNTDGNPLAWLDSHAYLKLAARSMNENVLRPLRERGIPVKSFPDGVTFRSR